MKVTLYLCMALMSLSGVCLSSCSNDEEDGGKDMEKPTVSDDRTKDDPIPCERYKRGEVIPFRSTFTDNVELGSISLNIHNNFDHHTHGTAKDDCPLDPIKKPVNPWVFNQTIKIPAGQKTYEGKLDIPIPTDIDPGDYHFMVYITDKAGWQNWKAVSFHVE